MYIYSNIIFFHFNVILYILNFYIVEMIYRAKVHRYYRQIMYEDDKTK